MHIQELEKPEVVADYEKEVPSPYTWPPDLSLPEEVLDLFDKEVSKETDEELDGALNDSTQEPNSSVMDKEEIAEGNQTEIDSSGMKVTFEKENFRSKWNF